MREYKVIINKWRHKDVAYYISASDYLTACKGAKHGVWLNNEEDMFIIANDANDAYSLLEEHLKKIGYYDNTKSLYLNSRNRIIKYKLLFISNDGYCACYDTGWIEHTNTTNIFHRYNSSYVIDLTNDRSQMLNIML